NGSVTFCLARRLSRLSPQGRSCTSLSVHAHASSGQCQTALPASRSLSSAKRERTLRGICRVANTETGWTHHLPRSRPSSTRLVASSHIGIGAPEQHREPFCLERHSV